MHECLAPARIGSVWLVSRQRPRCQFIQNRCHNALTRTSARLRYTTHRRLYMRPFILVAIGAAALLAGCNSSNAPAPQTQAPVQPIANSVSGNVMLRDPRELSAQAHLDVRIVDVAQPDIVLAQTVGQSGQPAADRIQSADRRDQGRRETHLCGRSDPHRRRPSLPAGAAISGADARRAGARRSHRCAGADAGREDVRGIQEDLRPDRRHEVDQRHAQ